MKKEKSNIKFMERANSIVEPAIDVKKREQENTNKKDEERENVFIKLLSGQEATKEIETSRGTFVVKFPKQKDRLAIGRLMSLNRGGLPVNSFDVETENRNLICSTLNVVVTGAPEWFESAKKRTKNFGFEEVPDEEFLLELYQKACSFRNEVQELLNPKERATIGRIPTDEGMVSNVEHGVFDGAKGETTS